MNLLVALLNLFCVFSWALLPATPATDSSFNAVVLLKIPGVDSDGYVVDGLCNGTLTSNDTLVTAAHCLAGSKLKNGEPITVEVGEYKYITRPDGNIVRVGYTTKFKHTSTVTAQFPKGVSYDSLPNKISPDNDFVFIRLHQAISLPEGFVFAKLWKAPLQQTTANSLFVVSINPVEYITTADTKQMAALNKVKFLNYQIQSQSNSRVAPGDSGAPLFASINGQSYLIGVTKGRAETIFSNWDVFAVWAERALQP